jgi:PPOX class probable FMN-dependent enzyme
MAGTPFADVVTSTAGLRDHYRDPSPTSLQKEIAHLDGHCRDFIAHATFAVLSTAGADGRCDVSPKGGPAGFVVVLDEHRLAIPDLIGNNRLDTLQNLVENPNVAVLFLIPGLDETLRVNGRGYVVLDDDVLDACVTHGRRPKAAIGIEVDVAYLHCAKALRRGDVWQPERWPDRSDMASAACMLRDHIDSDELTEELVAANLEESYTKRLW